MVRQQFQTGAVTARSGNSGSGLGLTIVRQIMELHGFKLLLHQKGDLFSVEIRFR